MEIVLHAAVVCTFGFPVHFYIIHRTILVDTIHARKLCEILRGPTTPAESARGGIGKIGLDVYLPAIVKRLPASASRSMVPNAFLRFRSWGGKFLYHRCMNALWKAPLLATITGSD